MSVEMQHRLWAVDADCGAARGASPPGMRPERLLRLMRKSIFACALDLRGRTVLTEAASGPYVVTPVLAALAGARVTAVTRTTRLGRAEDIRRNTLALAELGGVADQITITSDHPAALVGDVDIVTNSGHVRPIDANVVSAMRAGCVVALMYEAWEIQAGRFDVDLDALNERGVAYAGTNERHPAVDVFSYLGLMAVRLLLDAGIAPYGARIAVLCDNPFASYLIRGLEGAGATVVCNSSLDELLSSPAPEALVVALQPTGLPLIAITEAIRIKAVWPHLLIAQFWGDIDRQAIEQVGLGVWPERDPAPGHMAVLPSDVGPEPVVRLQTGGLKVGQVLLTPRQRRSAADLEYIDEL